MPLHLTTKAEKTAPLLSSSLLYESDWYQIKCLDYQLQSQTVPATGYNNSLCLVYIRQGYFPLTYPDRSHQIVPGYLLFDKPGYEYDILPSAGICTVINYTDRFYQQFLEDTGLRNSSFFTRKNLLSMAIPTTPATDFLHFELIRQLPDAGQLCIDHLVFELFALVIQAFDQSGERCLHSLPAAHWLAAVEMAKHYMYRRLSEDISLADVARSCHLSPFHFCRIFKSITGVSPNRYLQQIRLKNSELLLKQTRISIAEAAYLSGFNSLTYFDTAFKTSYGLTPTMFRNKFN